MIRIKLMDGGVLEIPREEAVELLPYRAVFESPMLKTPIEGLCIHHGKLIPVLGPMPSEDTSQRPVEDRAWLLVLRGCAQVVRGLPDFVEGTAENSSPLALPEGDGNEGLLSELDQLLKAA